MDNTDVVQWELLSAQIREQSHDIARRTLMTTDEVSYEGEGFKLTAKASSGTEKMTLT